MIDLTKLLTRLSCGGKVETAEESLALDKIASVLGKQMPKYACPECWFQRLLKEVRDVSATS